MLQKFGNYRIIEELSIRAFRSTYIAYPLTGAQQNVVLKIYDQACLNPSVDREQSFTLMNELAGLQHPAILPIEDMVLAKENLYVVTPYASQGSLATYLKTLAEPLNWRDALRIILDIGYGLSYAHKQHLLHGNLKPENILYNEKHALLISDFTLAPTLDSSKFNDLSDVHAARYKAPEQFADNLHLTSDQYALACLAYELISGQPPFDGTTIAVLRHKHFSEYPAPLTALVPHVPVAVELALSRALGKDRKKRFPDMAAFLHELNNIIARIDSTIAPSTPIPTAPPLPTTITPDKTANNSPAAATSNSSGKRITSDLQANVLSDIEELHRSLNSFNSPNPTPSISFNTHEEISNPPISGQLKAEKEPQRSPSGALGQDASSALPLEPFGGPLHTDSSTLKPFQELPVEPFPGLLSADTLFGNPLSDLPKNALPLRSLDPFPELLPPDAHPHNQVAPNPIKKPTAENIEGKAQQRIPSSPLPRLNPSSPLPQPNPPSPLPAGPEEKLLEPDSIFRANASGNLPDPATERDKLLQAMLVETDTLALTPISTSATGEASTSDATRDISLHATQRMNESTSVQPLILPGIIQEPPHSHLPQKPKTSSNMRQIWILMTIIVVILIVLAVVPLSYLLAARTPKVAKTTTTAPSSVFAPTPTPQILATYQAITTTPTAIATTTPSAIPTTGAVATMQATKITVPIVPTTIATSTPKSTTTQSTPTPTPAGITSLSINSGSGAVGDFIADTDVVGGFNCQGTDQVINTSGVSNPAPQGVYQTNRCGQTMTYTLPGLRANASYTVRLHFAETYWTVAGARVFNVYINNTAVLVNFDIFAIAGQDNAVVKQFTTQSASDGTIKIDFTTVTDNALISGIQVILAS